MSETDRLMSISAAIADGAPVSWSDEEQRVSSGGAAATLNALRDLEVLLTALRGSDREDEPTAETLSPPGEEIDTTAPKRWGHLVILGTIGKGTFATVYRAHDARLGVDVALKLLDRRFGIAHNRLHQKEAERVSSLSIRRPTSSGLRCSTTTFRSSPSPGMTRAFSDPPLQRWVQRAKTLNVGDREPRH